MALSEFFSRFYTKVFVGVYAQREMLHIGIVEQSRGGELALRHKAFEGGMCDEVTAFVQEAIAKTPYNYIAVASDAQGCGAVPTCSVSKAKEMAPAVAQSKTVCIAEEWMNYCDEAALVERFERYTALAPDAFYSPFALMHAFFETTMAGEHAVYIVLTPEAMSLAVVKERHLRFAEHYRCTEEPMVPALVTRIVSALEGYYGKPCCRGEFIEAVHVVDGFGSGEALAKALEEALLVETSLQEVGVALLCAETIMKESGYAI